MLLLLTVIIMTQTKEEIAAYKAAYYQKIKASGVSKIYEKRSRIKNHANRIAYTQSWRKRNPDKLKATELQRLADGRMYQSAKKWADRNPDKVKQYRKNTYWNHRDKRIEANAVYYQANRERIKARVKAYRQTPAGRITMKRSTAKIRSTAHGRLRHNISSAVRLKLLNHGGKKYRASIDKVLPFKISDLMVRLESMFLPGMTWNNIGEWHIDHIKADAKFNYASVYDPEFAQSWAITNLRPLWASDNCSKGSK